MKKITLVIRDLFDDQQKSVVELLKDTVYKNFNETINFEIKVERDK